ncbi:hypothetical protein [Pedobacter gandavensis]|uniref:hypothetical protein n=1 Tax=Pedobacter gandavensis TaxID=2679963 RepID=UPI00293061A3|nr:hypothetical protein [Pedobacter gandavensis]
MKGQDFTILVAKDGAGGNGHMGGIIQDGKGNYYYVTMGATENASLLKMATVGVKGEMIVQPLTGAKSMGDAIAQAKGDTNNSPYTDQVTFKTDSKTDQKIFESVSKQADDINSGKEKYNVVTMNCTDAIENPIEKATGISLPDNTIPNKNFNNLKGEGGNIQKGLDLSSGKSKVETIPSGLDGAAPKKIILPNSHNNKN